ncbi:MAG TPA: hypothetical protein VNK50_04570 [Calidithermus sp.]|nr:hypothetical protein [Calidithermus sp.]
MDTLGGNRRSRLLTAVAGQVVTLAPLRAARGGDGVGPDPRRCRKCGSGFIVHEPAFVHCRYCGAMTRRPHGSLPAQEEFELRSGLRLAS